jgi:hypothetical protein
MSLINITPVILCGGSSTRLWLLSRSAFPKQFLVLSGKKTLFQQAVERLQLLKNSSTVLNDTLIAIFGPEGRWQGAREKVPAAICRKIAMVKYGDGYEICRDDKQTNKIFLIMDEY